MADEYEICVFLGCFEFIVFGFHGAYTSTQLASRLKSAFLIDKLNVEYPTNVIDDGMIPIVGNVYILLEEYLKEASAFCK